MQKILILLGVCFLTTLFGSIGSISTIEGKVEIQRQNSLIQAQVNSEIERYDIITTGKDSIARIVLNDNTLITIGKESALNIEEYVFDEKDSSKNETNFNFFKGAFKSVTGKIGKINPSKFKLKTKSATIGIRGTTIIGNQERIIVLEGSVLVTSQNKSVIVNSGQYTNTLPNQAPSDAQDYNQDQEQPISEQLGEEEKEASGTAPKVEPNTLDKPKEADDVDKEKKDDDTKNDAQDIKDKIDLSILNNQRVYPTQYNKPENSNSSPSEEFNFEGYHTYLGPEDYSGTIELSNSNSVYEAVKTEQHHLLPTITTYDTNTYYVNSDYFGMQSEKGWFQAIPDVLNADGTYSTNSDNEVSWGYWNDLDGLNRTIKGTWVAGNSINLSSLSESGDISFSGHAIGYTKAIGNSTLNPILYNNNNSFNMNLNLGSGAYTGNLSFNTANGEIWSANFSGNDASGERSTFYTSNVGGTGAGGTISSGSVYGHAYGSNGTIKSVGGNFNLSTDSNQAIGSFIGTRQ
ncbi:FecR family protein [Halarcobacter ebronensis]|uniref:FecR protein domain-containing protein n=1 Tax=Halarcobacter ebronensis TaxID=1462615 RepID=A0A4Q1AN94_9BACT|nr:FecR family protein [Halarcobacter ebronensis]RXK07593.1 hypothetical protein CRV07_03790 [Halarcobacter ebronensis]